MRDLSLHILEVVERSIRSGASIISVNIMKKAAEQTLEIEVEDNGSGLECGPAGDAGCLGAFQSAARLAGGGLRVEKSELGGTAVRAHMPLAHLDRQPMGDLAATLSSVVCTNPGLDLWCRLSSDNAECEVRVSEVARELQVTERCGLAIARRVSERIRLGLAALGGRSH